MHIYVSKDKFHGQSYCADPGLVPLKLPWAEALAGHLLNMQMPGLNRSKVGP